MKKKHLGFLLSLFLHVTSEGYDSVYLKGSYGVNSIGAATYSIPLETPPGIKGVAPKLNLSYSSIGQDGIFGMGWNLSTFSTISRCAVTRTGLSRAVDLSANDNFCLDGVLLVSTGGNEYRTELDNYQKIFSIGATGSNHFVVYTKSGMKMTYGLSADSKVKAQSNPAIVKWALDSVTDLNGNYYKIIYQNDQVNGQHYPLEINYTGNISQGVLPDSSIKFFYETRPDTSTSYRANIKLHSFVRVKNIKTYVNENLVLDYRFTYKQSAQTGRTLLRKVQVFSADGSKSLLPSTFEWNGPNGEYRDDFALPANVIGGGQSIAANYVGGVEAGNRGSGLYTDGKADWITGDFNGDGTSDFIQLTLGGTSAPVCFGIFGGGGFQCTNYALPAKLPSEGTFIAADFDGDGLTDFSLITERISSRVMCYSDGVGQFICETKYIPPQIPITGVTVNLQYNGMPMIQKQYFAADFNGDGMTDTFGFSITSTSPQICFSNGRFQTDFCTGMQLPIDFTPINMVAGDFDGDSRTDIAYAPVNPLYTGAPGSSEPATLSNSVVICYSNGTSGFTCQAKALVPTTTGNCNGTTCYGPLFAGDFNGDGTSDLAHFMSTGLINIYPSMGRGITPEVTSLPTPFANIGAWSDNAFFVSDLNGDNKADIITKNGAQTEVCYSRGDKTFNCTLGPAIPQSKVLFGNFTGDANTSIVGAEVSGSYLTGYWNPLCYPDVISQITNGIGEKTDLLYQPLTNNLIYSKTSSSGWPIKSVQSPMWVISSEKIDNGNGGKREKNYKYYGLKHNLLGYGFLGFSQIEQTDPSAKLFIRTKYHQDFPLNGQIRELSRYVYNDVSQMYIKATDTSYTYEQASVYGNGFSRYFNVFLTDQQDRSYDINSGALLTNIHVNSKFDIFGNKTAEVTSTSEGHLVEKTFLLKNFNGDPNLDPTQWFLGRVEKTVQKNTNPDGTNITRATEYTYDSKHRMLQEKLEPSNATMNLTTTLVYDVFGNVTSKSASGTNLPTRTETTTYSPNGKYILAKQNSYGHTTRYSYDERFGSVIGVSDPNQVSVSSKYDEFGRKIKDISPDLSQTNYSYTVCSPSVCSVNISYFIDIKREGGATKRAFFDILDRNTISQDSGFSGKWSYQYKHFDNVGNVASISNKTNSSPTLFTVFTYDPLNRMLTQKNPDGSQVTKRYDGLSVISTNAKGHSRTETTNVIKQLISVKDDAGSVMKYYYDPFGNLIKTVDSKGNVSELSYNILGHKSSKKDKNSGTWTYSTNALGEVLSTTDAKGNVLTFTFDNLGRPLTQSSSDGVSTFVYDTLPNGKGKISSASRDNGYSKIYSYDTLGRVASIQTTMDTTYLFSMSYDKYSRMSKVTYPGGFAVNYNYGLNGVLTEVRRDGTNALLWQLKDTNADGKITEELLGNNITTKRTFDRGTGALSQITSTTSGGTVVEDVDLEYDFLGNLVERTDLINHSTGATLTENFAYDSLSRLISVSGNVAKSFTYDELGNMTSKTGMGNYTYGTGAVGSPIHAVTSIAGSTTLPFTYDANGNTLTGNGRTITWTSFNKPLRISNANTAIDFFYDATLERFKEVSSTCRDHLGAPSNTCVKYMINPAPGTGMHYEKETNGSVTTHRNYIYAGPGNMIGVYTTTSSGSQNTRYLHRDHLGSLGLVTDEVGGVVERLSYDAFGKRRYVDGSDDPDYQIRSIVSHQGFTLQEHLDEGGLGLVHMNGRVYDSSVGRFMSVDPHVTDPLNLQSFNRFSYVINNPLNLTDPTGFDFWEDFENAVVQVAVPAGIGALVAGPFGLVTGAAIGLEGSAGAISNYLNENPWVADVVYAAAAVAIIVASGGTLAGAVLAVASVAGGAMAASAALAAFQGGDFWENVGNNFHTNFRIGLVFLAGSALAAAKFGGGVVSAGGNGLNGWIEASHGYGPFQGGLTVGSATTYNGASEILAFEGGFFGYHEFGHTVQYIGLSALGGYAKQNQEGVFGSYLVLGAVGTTELGGFWETMATYLGTPGNTWMIAQ